MKFKTDDIFDIIERVAYYELENYDDFTQEETESILFDFSKKYASIGFNETLLDNGVTNKGAVGIINGFLAINEALKKYMDIKEI